MKRVGITILGILDIVACILLFIGAAISFLTPRSVLLALILGLPVSAAAILTLISSVYALKRRNWRWASTGLISAVVASLYYYIFVSIFYSHP